MVNGAPQCLCYSSFAGTQIKQAGRSFCSPIWSQYCPGGLRGVPAGLSGRLDLLRVLALRTEGGGPKREGFRMEGVSLGADQLEPGAWAASFSTPFAALALGRSPYSPDSMLAGCKAPPGLLHPKLGRNSHPSRRCLAGGGTSCRGPAAPRCAALRCAATKRRNNKATACVPSSAATQPAYASTERPARPAMPPTVRYAGLKLLLAPRARLFLNMLLHLWKGPGPPRPPTVTVRGHSGTTGLRAGRKRGRPRGGGGGGSGGGLGAVRRA